MFAADMKLPERILRDTRETQHRLVKRRVFALRLRIEPVGADRVTGRTETRHDLFTRDVDLLTLDDDALRLLLCPQAKGLDWPMPERRLDPKQCCA